MRLPPGFTTIGDFGTTEAKTYNFVGIIAHIEPIRPTRGTDSVLTFRVFDHTSKELRPGGLFCKVFQKDFTQEFFKNPPGNVGDVILVHNMPSQTFGNRIEGVASQKSYPRCSIVIMPQDKIPHPHFSVAYGIGGRSQLATTSRLAHGLRPEERVAVIQLKELMSDTISRLLKSPPQPVVHKPHANDKSALLKDVELQKFYDLSGEIVKKFSSGHGAVDLYFTDYTTNKNLFHYENPETAEDPSLVSAPNWKGPFGQVTLPVRAWEPHAAFINDRVQEGDFVKLLNVRIKLDKNNRMEGALSEDRMIPNKIYVQQITSEATIQRLKERKKDHEMNYGVAEARDVLARKPEYQQLGKVGKKREMKKEEERARKLIEQRELEEEADAKILALSGSNSHIRAGHPSIKPSSIFEILSNSLITTSSDGRETVILPFVNCNYRSCVRVVDFSPNSLEDFSRPMTDRTWNTKHGLGRRDDSWQWAFVLLVEDASMSSKKNQRTDRIPLFVPNDAAEGLLKMSATDLRSDSTGKRLKALEERLFIVWGNLLEAKKELTPAGYSFPLPHGDQRLQNRPFEVCIEEYGAKVPVSSKWSDGWQRTFRMAKTVIHD